MSSYTNLVVVISTDERELGDLHTKCANRGGEPSRIHNIACSCEVIGTGIAYVRERLGFTCFKPGVLSMLSVELAPRLIVVRTGGWYELFYMQWLWQRMPLIGISPSFSDSGIIRNQFRCKFRTNNHAITS